MMLAPVRAESNKGLSSVVTAVLLILVVLAIVSIIYTSASRFIRTSPEMCKDYVDAFKLENACYLNSGEVKVAITREYFSPDIKMIKLSLFPSNAVWEITGKKCTDVRLEGKEYEGYCDIVGKGYTSYYILDMKNLDSEEQITLSVEDRELCVIGEKSIKSSC